jgi:hypothetical protein
MQLRKFLSIIAIFSSLAAAIPVSSPDSDLATDHHDDSFGCLGNTIPTH